MEFGGASGLAIVEALSFDLDGTLLDGSPWREVIVRTCDDVARAHPELDAERLVGANTEVWASFWPQVEKRWTFGSMDGRAVTVEAWRRTLHVCGLDDESSVLHAAATYLRNRRAALRLFDDVRAAFRAVRPRPMALVTNGASDTQRDVLRVLRVERDFAAVAISGEVGVAKPDPAIFRVALKKLGVSPEKTWHVGDSLTTDVVGAQRAGLTAVWLNRDAVRRREGDPEPDYEIRSLRELLGLLSN